MGLEEIKRAEEVVDGDLEGGRGGGVEGDVEVDAPFRKLMGLLRRRIPYSVFRKGVGEIAVTGEVAGFIADDGLVEVDGVVELL